jgi:uncharacterized protein
VSVTIIVFALLIGISLGLIGGGGSILTVPVLVYIAGISPMMATAYSLFIVGTTSLVGAGNYFTKKLVHIPTAIIFSIPSFIAVYAVRRYIIPMIPDTIFTISGFTVTKSILIMVVFALIMFFAAISMIRDKKGGAENEDITNIKFNYPLISAEGLLVGALTGFVGAGGGFLIIPALVMFAKLPMRLAIGTSLLIIAIKSLIGFIGDVQNINGGMDWTLLGIFTAVASGGIFIGSFLSKKIEVSSLKKVFGWFVLVMAVYILMKELIK